MATLKPHHGPGESLSPHLIGRNMRIYRSQGNRLVLELISANRQSRCHYAVLDLSEDISFRRSLLKPLHIVLVLRFGVAIENHERRKARQSCELSTKPLHKSSGVHSTEHRNGIKLSEGS